MRKAPPGLDLAELREAERLIYQPDRIAPSHDKWLQNRVDQLIAQGRTKDLTPTDEGAAERLIMLHGDGIKYCPHNKTWYVYDGRRWKADVGGLETERLALDVSRMLHLEAFQRTAMKEIAQAALQYQDTRCVRRMIAATRKHVPISPDELDKNPYLINVNNGTVRLRYEEGDDSTCLNGRLREARQSDNITKISPIEFDEYAKCPLWEESLLRWMDGNPDLVAFLQRAVGYSLTASVGEQLWFFLWGRGANGKSAFIQTILSLMGEYGAQAPHDLLVRTTGRQDKEAMATLMGCRFAPAVEIPEGAQLAEVISKILTGGDQVVGRLLYKGLVTFSPTWKIWLVGNSKPQIRSRDEATWRRICLIPFPVRIPENERDKHLVQKLEKELPGILNWAIRGCLEWQHRGGLEPPQEVVAAIDAYRNETDFLGDFLSRYEINRAAKIPASDVYADYMTWAEIEGIHRPLGRNTLYKALEERSWEKKRVENRAAFIGRRQIPKGQDQ